MSKKDSTSFGNDLRIVSRTTVVLLGSIILAALLSTLAWCDGLAASQILLRLVIFASLCVAVLFPIYPRSRNISHAGVLVVVISYLAGIGTAVHNHSTEHKNNDHKSSQRPLVSGGGIGGGEDDGKPHSSQWQR